MSIMVWGHRGHRHYLFPQIYGVAPYENSLRAFEEALKSCDGIECDLIQSYDNTIYLAHGTSYDEHGMPHELTETLDENSRQLVGGRFIYQLSDEVVSHLRLADSQPLPTLDEFFRLASRYPKAFLNLELKGPLEVPAVVNALDKAVAKGLVTMDRIVLSSFYFRILLDLREKYGRKIKIGCLFDSSDFPEMRMYPDWPEAPQEAHYVPFHVGALSEDVIREMSPDFFHLEWNSLTEEGLAEIARLYPQAKITIWTSGERHPDQDTRMMDVLGRYAKTGLIHAVISDFPEAMKKAVAKAGF